MLIVAASATVSYFINVANEQVSDQVIAICIVVGLFLFNNIIDYLLELSINLQRLDTLTNKLR